MKILLIFTKNKLNIYKNNSNNLEYIQKIIIIIK